LTIQKAGVDSTLMTIPGAGHGPEILTPEAIRAVAAFFDKHLKGGSEQTPCEFNQAPAIHASIS
jgi:hypothetical protein